MANLLDLMVPNEIITYLSTRNPVLRVGDALFPNRKTDALEVEYLKGANGLPVAATVHSWDSEAQIGSRGGAESVKQEMTLIKRKLPVREREIIAINNPRTDAELDRLIKTRYNDVDTLVDGVLARVEAMKMEAVAKGVININENGIVGTIDYGVPANQKVVLAGANMFSDPTADILGQLQAWVDLMRGKGITVTRAITSNAVMRLMAANEKIRLAINGVNSAMLVSNNALNDFFTQQGLPTFITYDEMYNVQNTDGTYTAKRFFDEDYIALLPEGDLGEGLFGPTAEEVDLSSDPSIDVSMVGNVLAMVYKTPDPVVHWTKAVAAFMPSFPAANNIMSVKVK